MHTPILVHVMHSHSYLSVKFFYLKLEGPFLYIRLYKTTHHKLFAYFDPGLQ